MSLSDENPWKFDQFHIYCDCSVDAKFIDGKWHTGPQCPKSHMESCGAHSGECKCEGIVPGIIRPVLKQRIIIYDGPDRCGKTNMAYELSKRIEVPRFKNHDEHKYFLSDPSYFLHAARYIDTYFTSYLEASGASVILDRSWPSEWVYSQVLGREWDPEVLTELDQRHAKLGTHIIIPYRTDYSKVKDDYDSVNQNIQKISDRYKEFAKWSKCKCLLLNVDDEDLDREIREILEFLEK